MYEEAGNSNLIMLLNTAVYPFLVAAILTLLLSKVNRVLITTSLGAGFLIGLSLIHQGLNIPPSKALDFLTVTVLLGIISTLIEPTKFSPVFKHLFLMAALWVSFYLLLNPVLKHQSQAISLVWAASAAFLVLVISRLQTHEASAKYSHAPAISLIIVAATSAPVVSIGGSLLLGQLLGVLAASLAGVVVIQRFIWNASSISTVTLGSFVLAGLLAQAHVLADLPAWTVALAYISLLTTVISGWILKEDGSIISTLKAITPQVIISGAIAAISLWYVWPESSLY
ncbi:hypothetical protein DN730_13365 [Marinomonas piezotolerans]|uniref:Uncharacterized protein n=1 Tax=Marinomonas piezotolerans TaxID=2213058 RepID=A0A370U7F5_9GAMM|nr:hypothetical protein [Marinomonas piezotolerans]RDL43730.1 hypothetical protein DN730_13365 [Marinomonas piezotolerans]